MRMLTIEHLGRPKKRDNDSDDLDDLDDLDDEGLPYELPDYDDI